jgi:hypothetical protein
MDYADASVMSSVLLLSEGWVWHVHEGKHVTWTIHRLDGSSQPAKHRRVTQTHIY